jgi:hypothetical protein
MRHVALGLALMLAPGAAVAQDRVALRVGSHADHGRLVVDTRGRVEYRVEEEPGRVVLRIDVPAGVDLSAARRPPRNAMAIEAVEGGIAVTVPPGVRLRHFRLENRIVLDLLDPRAAATAPRATPRAAPPASRGQAPAAPEPAPAAVAAPPPTATLPPPALPSPPPRPPAIEVASGSIAIPARPEVGAALFRRGGTWMFVLDAPLPLDGAALRADPLLAAAEILSGPRATVLRLPAAALREPVLSRSATHWRLAPAEGPPALRSILPEAEAGPPPRLALRASRPGEAVPVLDPETGATLLVGTVLAAGEATPTGRSGATLDLLPTRLGVAVLPRADRLTLRALADRFVADADGAPLALGPVPADGAAGAATMSRHFDLPAEEVAALWARERNAMLAVAAAPPLGRAAPRLRAAEALLALGLGQEAQAMAALAMREDPRAAADPRAQALAAAAALVGGRTAEASALGASGLPDTDEAALWRGLLAAARGEPAAPALATRLPLLLSYPEPLRTRLLPLAAEALAAGGEVPAARRLLATRDAADPSLALARARLREAEGAVEEALAAYDAIARGRDRRSRAVAMRRAAELRLSTGQLDAAGAAAAVEATLAAWRGDALETEARSRAAELRMQAGDPRGAFDLLRETETLFPDLASALRPRQAAALVAALEREAPVAAVALFDSHAALLPPGAATERALAMLADRLAALDLADRARAVLRGAVARADGPEARARIGVRLAALSLGAGDPAGARIALADTAAAALPHALREERALLEARALARLGAYAEAEARFREAGPAAAPELAEFLAGRQEWRGAAAALGAHLRAVLPGRPAALDAGQQQLVARHAALLALAGEQSALAELAAAESSRMGGGAMREAFALLTADRLAGTADLPRLRQELEFARALPGRLESLRAEPGVAR